MSKTAEAFLFHPSAFIPHPSRLPRGEADDHSELLTPRRRFESGRGYERDETKHNDTPVLKRTIMRRFERRVPGSNPGGGMRGKPEIRNPKPEERTSPRFHSGFWFRNSGFNEVPVVERTTTRACEARIPGSIPGGGK
jgi:hypothetical protein